MVILMLEGDVEDRAGLEVMPWHEGDLWVTPSVLIDSLSTLTAAS